MNFYDDLVMQTQMNYSRHYPIYASGSTPYQLTDKKPLPYSEQIHRLVQEVKEADCVVVGGASGLSAAGGGDFYYEDNDSYRKYFRPFAEKYHFKGAFAGMMHPWKTREEYWGYLATFLHTTQTAPVRHSYLDLDALLKGKDFFILTTNQDTQFVKLYPEEKVAEIQGDHRFFQCAACCTDDTWDAVKPVADMVAAMGDDTKIHNDRAKECLTVFQGRLVDDHSCTLCLDALHDALNRTLAEVVTVALHGQAVHTDGHRLLLLLIVFIVLIVAVVTR